MPLTKKRMPTLFTCAAALLQAGCMSMNTEEARSREYYFVTELSDWLPLLLPTLPALLLLVQAFIPALLRFYAAVFTRLLKALGVKRLLPERAALLARYVARLGFACGLFLSMLVPVFMNDCYFPQWGLALPWATCMDVFVAGLYFLLAAISWLTLRFIASWWRLNRYVQSS